MPQSSTASLRPAELPESYPEEAWPPTRGIGSEPLAFARLYERYKPDLYAMCLSRLRDPAAAEDIVQETFVRALANLSRFDPQREPWPWLRTIADRLCSTAQRRAARTYPSDDPQLEHRAKPAETDSLDSTTDMVFRGEQRAGLMRALSALPRRQRTVLLLHVIEGWSYNQIATAEGLSVSALKSLIFRARARLRSLSEGGILGLGGGIGTSLAGFRTWARTTATQAKVRAARMRTQVEALRVMDSLHLPSLHFVALALTVTMAGSPSLAGDIVSRPSEPVASVAESGARGLVAPTEGAPPESPPPKDPMTVDEAKDTLVKQLTDPTGDATPEKTHFTSVVPSPNFAADRTLYAAGWLPCYRPTCPVLFVSRDAGASWEQLPATGFEGQFLQLSPGFASDRRIFAMGPGGLQESTDAGMSFRTVSPLPGEFAVSPSYDEVGNVVLISSGALFEYVWSTEGHGSMWPSTTPVADGVPSPIAFSPDGSDLVLFGGVRPRAIGPTWGAIVHRCAGSSCTEVDLPGLVGMPTLRFMRNPRGGQVAYAFNRNGLYVSADDGLTFTRVAVPLGDKESISDLALSSAAPGLGQDETALMLAVHGPDGAPGLLASRDGGATWYRIPQPASLFPRGTYRLAVAGERMVATSFNTGLACSVDQGATWTPRCPAPS